MDFNILCIIIIANIPAIAPSADVNSFPNKFNILFIIVSLFISPFNASCRILLISISSKKSPVYCFDSCIKLLIPNSSCCSVNV